MSHPDNDLTTLRANLKSLVLKNLLASPFLTRFYVDSVIHNFPNSNEAKILARNYQKIIDRITMANPKSCTHIKVTGARCDSPALRGEQFCYFHQHAHRGVRRPSRSRLHPIALIESEEAIQASLMEVINGLLRNTLDVKRAELILRALHIAVKNARNVKFDSKVYPKVREIPEYAEPATENLETMDHAGTVAIVRAAGKASELVMKPDPFDESLPAVAAVSCKPVDPRDPHCLERSEEGGRVLAQEEALRHATVRVGTDAFVRPASAASMPKANAVASAAGKEDNSRIGGRDASTAPCLSLRSDAAPLSTTKERDTHGGNAGVDPTKRKPPVNVKAQSVTAESKTAAAPKERKNAAQRASAG